MKCSCDEFYFRIVRSGKLQFYSARLKTPAVCTKTAFGLSTVVCYPVRSDLDHGTTGVHTT